MNLRRTLHIERLEDRITPSTLQPGFTEQEIVGGLDNPSTMTIAPDGRIFVAQQDGEVLIVQGGNLLPTPFMSINTRSDGELGLLGFALDPNFETNGFVYVYYRPVVATGAVEFNRVSRFTSNGNVVDPTSEKVLLNLDPIVSPSNDETHNGGCLQFGTDGKLYIATGDNAYGQSSQSLTSTSGKILRINSDGTIPSDNPTSFQGVSGTTSGIYRSIYAIGFRNPFTFAVQPGTGTIFVNDVGSSYYEEINVLSAGKNYGWPQTEGPTTDPNVTGPVYYYAHTPFGQPGYSTAIAGGTFYDPATSSFPSTYTGDYFFADFVNSFIKTFNPVTGAVSTFISNSTVSGIVNVEVDSSGNLYYLARGADDDDGGTIFRISYSNSPAISIQPASTRINIGQTTTFSVSANGAGPLSYQWELNGFNIIGATSSSYTIPTSTAADNQGSYRVVVTNSYGSIVSDAAILTVTATTPPTANITSPKQQFIAGDTYTVTGNGIDPVAGLLPGSAMSWEVDYYTGQADPRPFVNPTPGTSITFTIPNTSPYTLDDVFYRVTLTVTNSSGETGTTTQDLTPIIASITVAASVPEVSVVLSGSPVGQIDTYLGVAGIQRTLSVPDSVTVGSNVLPFIGWSDGVTSDSRTITTPTSATTYLALYKQPTTTPAGIAVGAGFGGGPEVKMLSDTGTVTSDQFDFNDQSRGGVSVVTADFNGDGIPDTAVGSGPGTAPEVSIFDGATGLLLMTADVFESSFTGGVYVNSGDFTSDGKADLIVTPGTGGGPRVRVLNASDFSTIYDFMGINDPSFRGGAQAAAGDINGDGIPDIVVAAGDLGAPRIAGWNGAALAQGKFVSSFPDFYAFNINLRGGAFVSLGDVNGDGVDDIVIGSGAGGGPDVEVYSGKLMTANAAPKPMADFFVGDVNARGGIRVLARDIDGNGKDQILAATGDNEPSIVYATDETGKLLESWQVFPTALEGGVYIG